MFVVAVFDALNKTMKLFKTKKKNILNTYTSVTAAAIMQTMTIIAKGGSTWSADNRVPIQSESPDTFDASEIAKPPPWDKFRLKPKNW